MRLLSVDIGGRSLVKFNDVQAIGQRSLPAMDAQVVQTGAQFPALEGDLLRAKQRAGHLRQHQLTLYPL
jgi:hypothetical protein